MALSSMRRIGLYVTALDLTTGEPVGTWKMPELAVDEEYVHDELVSTFRIAAQLLEVGAKKMQEETQEKMDNALTDDSKNSLKITSVNSLYGEDTSPNYGFS